MITSSPIQSMASSCFNTSSYQKLKKLPLDHTQEDEAVNGELREVVVLKAGRRRRRSGWVRLNRSGRWRRPRVRVAGLRRFLRRKARVVGAAVAKVVKRLKEGSPYIGELFAGNYMFMQVSPSPTIPYVDKSFLPAAAAATKKHHYQHGLLPQPTIRFNVPSVASKTVC